MAKQGLNSATSSGKLRAVLEFLATCHGKERRETLPDPDALAGWLAHHELLSAETSIGEDDYRNALELRAGLQHLVTVRCGSELSPKVLRRLNDALGDATYRIRFLDAETAGRLPRGDGWPLARTRLVEAVLESMNANEWRRLKVCPGCREFFLDDSRGGNAVWCPGKRCLSRKTSERYRRRRGQKRRGPLG